MITVTIVVFIVLLPYWLPKVFISLRMLIFTKINGPMTLCLPKNNQDAQLFQTLYEHPKLRGKSQGAGLSDLFWYWLSPGAYIHQEHLEEGAAYDKLSKFTREILSVPKEQIEKLLSDCLAHFPLLHQNQLMSIQRIRDYMLPFWSKFYYELIFKEPCPENAYQLLTEHTKDVINALKCCRLRDMKKRYALTDFLRKKIISFDKINKPFDFPLGFSLDDQVYFLQGNFFTTAIVQMSDALSQLIMTLAKNPLLQNKMAKDISNKSLYLNIINETFRLFPLFGITHRIALEDINLDKLSIKKGTVVCFNYETYQKIGFANPEKFQAERWNQCPIKNTHYIPFGVAKNRMCPAQNIALISIRKLLQLLLSNYYFASSAKQTRALANRGPVLIIARKKLALVSLRKIFYLITMNLIDRWQSIYISLSQLIYGTIMLIEAKKLKLATNYFSCQNNACAQDKNTTEDKRKCH